MKKSIFSAVFAFFVISACTPSTNNVAPSNTTPVDVTKVTALIEQKCTSCHSTKTTASNGIAYDSYDAMVKGARGINKTIVIQRSMPQGSVTMTKEERTLIKQWAEQVSK